jgi:hypothetical protein
LRVTLVCVLLLAASAAATTGPPSPAAVARGEGKARPDFSGTWELDRSKSDFGPFGGRPLAKADSTIVVTHRDPELKIARTLRMNGREETREFVYYTDGRGETNPAAFGGPALKTQTKWEGERVWAYAKTTWPARDGRPAVELETTQRWHLSSGGRTLTHATLYVNGPVTEEMRLVYRRAG